jgi:putative two-component system response regulator
MDVMMPGMSGLDVLTAVRADPATAGVPVVMYSAVTDPAVRRRAMDLGAVDYLVKSRASYDELQATVDRYSVPT